MQQWTEMMKRYPFVQENAVINSIFTALFRQSIDGVFLFLLEQPFTLDEGESVTTDVLKRQQLVICNEALAEQYGLQAKQMIGRSAYDLSHRNLAYALTTWTALYQEGYLTYKEEKVPFSETPFWIDGDYYVLKDEHEQIIGHFGIQRDVTRRIQTARQLKENERKYRLITENSHDFVFLVNYKRQMVYASPQCAPVMPYLWEEIQRDEAMMDDYEQKVAIKQAILTFVHDDGTLFNFEVSGTYIEEDHTYLFIAQDVTERQKTEEYIHYLAYQDSITSLVNRRFFEKQCHKKMVDGQPFAIYYFDIDQFKYFNDSFSHRTGDQLLRLIAERLSASFTNEEVIARMGGDEFALLVSLDDGTSIYTVAKRIIALFEAPFTIASEPFTLSCSIGIAQYPEHGSTFDLLFRAADKAMYTAKERKLVYCLYDESMNTSVLSEQRLLLAHDLREAIAKQQFVVYYQPQVCGVEQATIGFEALIRWQHPRLGLVPPSDFIPLAEEIGYIVEIERWVLQQACLDISAMIDYLGHRDFKVAVNISALHLTEQLVQDVAIALRISGAPPSMLDLEITETIAIYSPQHVIELLRQLKELGVYISIDDFGTGYSSLSYLKDFPVDRLKIDRSFLLDVPRKQSGQSIIETIISLAHSMKIEAFAEGVETEEQLEFLMKRGCHQFQGYYFSPPKPLEQLFQMAVVK